MLSMALCSPGERNLAVEIVIRPAGRTLSRTMKAIGISDLRQRVAEVLRRSRKARPIASPEHNQFDLIELRALRHERFLGQVRDAEAEYQAGAARHFADIEDLLDRLRP